MREFNFLTSTVIDQNKTKYLYIEKNTGTGIKQTWIQIAVLPYEVEIFFSFKLSFIHCKMRIISNLMIYFKKWKEHTNMHSILPDKY